MKIKPGRLAIVLGLALVSGFVLASCDNNVGSDPPSGVTAAAIASNMIHLKWKAENGTGYYYIYRTQNPSSTYSYYQQTTAASWDDTYLSPNTTYYYKVSSYDSKNSKESGLSSAVWATTWVDTPLYYNYSTYSATSNSITVTWNSSTNASNYYIYRSSSEYGPFIFTGQTIFTNYTDDGLSPSTTYYYTVSALNSENVESAQSSVLQAYTTK